MTADARSGDIINMEEAMNINHDEEHKLVEGGPRDLVAVLLFKSASGRDDHFSARKKNMEFNCCMAENRSIRG